MPHLFTNRARLHNLTKGREDLHAHFRWETVNAIFYLIGGLVFICGSIFFFPRYEKYANIGAWTFFAGSLLYLVVTGHDMAEVRHAWRTSSRHDRNDLLEYTAAASYVLGTILFIAGSIFFVSTVGWLIAGARCFIIGSMLFVLGACINVVQIVQNRSLVTLQLMNYTAVAFVAGSILFTVASVPYLWSIKNRSDRILLYTFLAWQYLVGSGLFFVGGVFNYWRAYVVLRDEIHKRNGADKSSTAAPYTQ